MKTIYALITMMILISACSSTPINPSKPEMSVPEKSTYKTQPKTFNQFHKDWDY